MKRRTGKKRLLSLSVCIFLIMSICITAYAGNMESLPPDSRAGTDQNLQNGLTEGNNPEDENKESDGNGPGDSAGEMSDLNGDQTAEGSETGSQENAVGTPGQENVNSQNGVGTPDSAPGESDNSAANLNGSGGADSEQSDQPDRQDQPGSSEPSDLSDLSGEEKALIEEIQQLIAELPSSEEIGEKLDAYDAAGDDEGYEAYFGEVYQQVMTAYLRYQELGETLQARVSNRDKLLEMEWLWSAMPLAVTNTVDVTAVNNHNDSAGAIIYHKDTGASVKDFTRMGYSYWYAIQIEEENGQLIVKQILSNSNISKADVYASGKGFVLIYRGMVNVNVGDAVTVSSNFWKTTHAYNNGKVYGTVTFSSSAKPKTPKNNSSQLHVISGADTRDYIELNLYDYGSGSTGKNINDKYNANKKMPGFQQSGGTRNIDDFNNTAYFNFGDIITSDLADGKLVTAGGEGINKVIESANSPISKEQDVMSQTLINGYPALADGSSLGYLFGAEAYSKKMNNQSINGLFQYDETTGAYSFNSRENFAQFNQGSDTFTLYKEIFTPNFIMYPFGNFMPFNDIVSDSKQVSQINKAYFKELQQQASYLYQQGKGEQYAQLAKVLGQFIDEADRAGWGEEWNAEKVLNHYFQHAYELPDPGDDHDFHQISLDDIYSLDYDVASDFYFGMEMKMEFMQPKNGLTGKDGKQPMNFYFTGDDDVWVYIDGQLFLDLSGIHRHVGGEIDFVNGVVKYYSLDTKTGDVSSTAYKEVSFRDLVSDLSMLNAKNTFKDYSNHTFNFYYMERGSGSSVCRLNFNMPLLQKNSISVTKELSVDGDSEGSLLGNPDFYFQILKENGTELFIGEGTSYDIYNESQTKIGTGTVGKNGIFALKARQTAVFTGITEDAGKYFVRELLPDGFEKQYGTITVDGTSQTVNYDVIVGGDKFAGVNSTVKDMSDGATSFTFNNQVTTNKLGSLEIEKVLIGEEASDQSFDFEVSLDGVKLPVNTPYTIKKDGQETQKKTVAKEGIITIAPGEKAVIPNILAGSQYTVRETSEASAGYKAEYVVKQEDGTVKESDQGAYVAGTIKPDTAVSVTAKNTAKGTELKIPVTKVLKNPDGKQHTYTFSLEQVKNQNGGAMDSPGESQTAEVVFGAGGQDTEENRKSFEFTLRYLEKNLTQSLPADFYYKITETENASETNTGFDPAEYIVKVTVQENTSSGELTAQITGAWKDGEAITASNGVFPIGFTNELWESLKISKLVERADEGTGGTFSFEVTVEDKDGQGLSGEYPVTRIRSDESQEESKVEFSQGKATISLGHKESLVIHRIPYQAAWTVTETSADGYQVSFQIGGQDSRPGNKAEGTITDDEGKNTVTFTNKTTYELPETGGGGTIGYTALGILLLLLSICSFTYYFRKGRRA